VGYYIAPFYTEAGHDYLEMGRADDYGGMVAGTWSGSWGYRISWRDVDVLYHFVPPPPYGEWWQPFPAYLQWVTDAATYLWPSGFYVPNVRACRTDRGDLGYTHWMNPSRRVDGMLLGTGDVVYFYHYNGTETVGHNFVVGKIGNESNDIDVYVRCGARPTESSYYLRGYTGGSDEFIHIPPGASFCKGQGIHVAVHSFSGKGAFYLTYSKVKPEHLHSVVTAGSDFNINKNDVEFGLEKAGRELYGFTEGQVFIDQFHYYHNQSCKCPTVDCDICFTQSSHPSGFIGTCPITWSGSGMDLYEGTTGYAIIAHEMGHCFFNQRDEYYLSGGMSYHQCGYTIMANSDTLTKYDICVAHNHRLDKYWSAPDCPHEHGWYYASWAGSPNSYVSVIPEDTPDPTRYYYHPMAGRIKYVEK